MYVTENDAGLAAVRVVLSGVMVIVLAIGPKVHGFKPS
jgi:hypothetical protein